MRNMLTKVKDLRCGDRILSWPNGQRGTRVVEKLYKMRDTQWHLVTFRNGFEQASAPSNLLLQVEREGDEPWMNSY